MAVTKASEYVRTWLETGTQQELANVIGERIGRKVCQSTISAIKRGEATPRGDIMSALHAELQIDIGWWSEPALDAPPMAPPSSVSVSDIEDPIAKAG
jgi:transcriptional regulator with XRE-family HTH domain